MQLCNSGYQKNVRLTILEIQDRYAFILRHPIYIQLEAGTLDVATASTSHLFIPSKADLSCSSNSLVGMPLLSNVPALRLALAYALHDPASLLPHATIPNLLYLPIPIASGLPTLGNGKKPTIRALVLDKDNTLCPPETSKLHPAYLSKLEKLKASPEFSHNKSSILIVSNTAGSTSAGEHEDEALFLEQELGIPVLRQQPGRKKPLCGPDVVAFFKEHGVTNDPAEIAFVGDRLATDVIVAHQVGSWSFWCKDGWRNPEIPGRDYGSFFNKLERRFESIMRNNFSKTAPLPPSKAIK